MARQDELKKILEQLQNKTIDSAAASKALEGMFTRIESDMGKIRDAEGAPGKGIESAIKVQYVGLSDTIGKMGEESAETSDGSMRDEEMGGEDDSTNQFCC